MNLGVLTYTAFDHLIMCVLFQSYMFEYTHYLLPLGEEACGQKICILISSLEVKCDLWNQHMDTKL